MRNPDYDKPLLTSITLHWVTGFHSSSENVNRYIMTRFLLY